jgi:hypothetical protein
MEQRERESKREKGWKQIRRKKDEISETTEMAVAELDN